MRKMVVAGAVALFAAAPAASRMTLAEFLPKANALEAKGAMALFSRDLKPVMTEMKAVSAEMKAEAEQRRAAGLPKRACPPAGTKLDSGQMLAMLNAIPPAERGVSVKDGFLRAMAARFPCR